MIYKFLQLVVILSVTFISYDIHAYGNDTLIAKDYNYNQIENLANRTELKYLKIDFYKDTILPTNIGKLINLEYLEINFAHIRTLPPSIGNLVKLETLVISNGNVNIIIPPEIGKLVHLKELNIYNFNFNSLPSEIGNLIELEETMLCGDLTELPATIVKWTKMKRLYLSGNKFNKIPSQIFELKQLEYLDLSRNEILKVNDSLIRLSNLNDFNLEGNFQIDKLPETICGLNKLKTIYITNTKISSLPLCLKDITSLETIKMCLTLVDNPQEIEKKFNKRIKWESSCRQLKHNLVNYSEIYGHYNLTYKNRRDTLILSYNYFYDEPGVIDEEYSRHITIKIINKDSLKTNKIYSASNSNFIISTSHSSIWDWSNPIEYRVEGYIQIVDISNFKYKVYLNLDLLERGERIKMVDKLLIFRR